MKNYPPFYHAIEKADPELFKIITTKMDKAMEPGALDAKSKYLILLAVDAFAGSSGVNGISQIAKSLGATKQEMLEALQIAYTVGGNRILHTAENIFAMEY